MNNDSQDTVAMDDTLWPATQVDDVFVPAVRVQLGWRDVEAAVARGAIVPRQAHSLWAGWASPLSGLRVGAPSKAKAVDSALAELNQADSTGALQRYGLLMGLLLGAVLGAAGTYFALV